MEKAEEEPPSAAVPLDHASFSQVIFNSVDKFYVPGGDVTCYYVFTQQFTPRRKDWIGIFRVKVEETEQHNKELHQENQELKARCARLEEQSSVAQAELQRKQEELETLQSINKKLEQEAEEQKARWDGERLQLKEQNQKMRSENEQLGTRVAELQREQQQKLEQAVEEMKLRETAALKTQADLMNENLDLSRRLGENQLLYDCLRGEKEQMERENDHLRKENSRLLNYMGLDFDPLPHQVPASDQEGAGQKPGLVYGNPYSGIQESSTAGPLTAKKCHVRCQEPPQAQSPSLTCPICDRVFPATEKQIFEDHVYCHSL
ncbi:calcium-binding and coiled-coil domain-containing protein 2-like [Erethizon dorsatum]